MDTLQNVFGQSFYCTSDERKVYHFCFQMKGHCSPNTGDSRDSPIMYLVICLLLLQKIQLNSAKRKPYFQKLSADIFFLRKDFKKRWLTSNV